MVFNGFSPILFRLSKYTNNRERGEINPSAVLGYHQIGSLFLMGIKFLGHLLLAQGVSYHIAGAVQIVTPAILLLQLIHLVRRAVQLVVEKRAAPYKFAFTHE
jgi:hypothetical protein